MSNIRICLCCWKMRAYSAVINKATKEIPPTNRKKSRKKRTTTVSTYLAGFDVRCRSLVLLFCIIVGCISGANGNRQEKSVRFLDNNNNKPNQQWHQQRHIVLDLHIVNYECHSSHENSLRAYLSIYLVRWRIFSMVGAHTHTHTRSHQEPESIPISNQL